MRDAAMPSSPGKATSAARPPAFPAVMIGGHACWAGEIYSNTPLEQMGGLLDGLASIQQRVNANREGFGRIANGVRDVANAP